MLVIRLVLGAVLPLTEDEAYYRIWSLTPALGYYDHPPMVAWWIWLGRHLVGDDALGVRLIAVLSSALTSFLVFDLTRLAGGTGADAERAGIWYNAMPLVAAGGLLSVPDAPAALFWTMTLWLVFRALKGEGAGWWVAAGLAAGLATLSKYSALFLGPGVLLWLVSTPRGRASLLTPGPWVALTAAASLFALNVWWNETHDWASMLKQFGRITPHRLAPRYLVEFLLTEFLLVNPLLALFLVRRPAVAAPFVLTSLPFIAYLIVHSLHDRVQAHWPAPVFPALAIWAACASVQFGRRWSAIRKLVPWVGLGATAALGVYAALPLAGVPLLIDPALPLRGWPRFANRVETLRRETASAWLATTSYGLAAQLTDQPAIRAPVLQISERDRWTGLGQGPTADASRRGLLVELPRRVDLAALGRCFSSVRPLGRIRRGPPEGANREYVAVLLDRPRRDVLGEGCAAN
jgi:hypothetical protein